MTHPIFVYGTLKSGHSRNSFLKNQRYLGTALTTPEYKMFRYSSFPALVKVPLGNSIFGEVYEVNDSCILELDEVEGVQHGLFFRSEISLDQINLFNLPLYKRSSDLLLTSSSAVAYFFTDKEKLFSQKKDCGSNWVLNDGVL